MQLCNALKNHIVMSKAYIMYNLGVVFYQHATTCMECANERNRTMFPSYLIASSRHLQNTQVNIPQHKLLTQIRQQKEFFVIEIENDAYTLFEAYHRYIVIVYTNDKLYKWVS